MIKYLKLYRIILRNFGFRVRPLATFGLIQLHHLFSASTRALDHVVTPGFRHQALDRPVFILGNPRSGTTFLHRFLLNTEELCAFRLWEMLFPALTARRLLGGAIDRFAPLSPARYHGGEAHETSLRDVETDDAMHFFHSVDGGFLWSYFWAWEDTWDSPLCRRYFAPRDEAPDVTEKYFRFFEGCWRRNVFQKKARPLVKSSTMTMRVETLLSRYPDSRLLYCVRDPVETIPSGMSLLTGVLENAYDMFRTAPAETRARYLENLYQASCHLFRAFHEVHARGAIPGDRLRIVPYRRLTGDLENLMRELVEFLEISPPPAFWEKVGEQSDVQRTRQSANQYSLEKFGLTEERIRRDLAFVYDTYDV
ncbi:MAG: sulfotransferase [Deltaproteobacteria bacterium]|nr:sulfotransferase [Deltaproteobacteria bacterium]